MATKSTYPASAEVLDVTRCACADLRKTTRAVTQFYHAALKAAGLTPNQFTILATLERRGATAQSALAQALVMDRTTLIRNLKPLLAKDWVAAHAQTARGVKTLSLTEAGADRLGAALPLWREAQAHVAWALGPERWGQLAAGLDAARDAVERA